MKRFTDIVLSSTALVVLWPVMVVAAILVRWHLGSPVFYRQRRPGLNASPFLLVKFRTMQEKHDNSDKQRSDAERLTRFGRMLRATSLDELPELWNVVLGEMSLVGPRPLLLEYLPLYTSEQGRRHDVRPGITGWAQVNGRNSLTWEERFALDVWYVDNWSFWLDAKIVFLTFRQILRRDGINAPGDATMPKFTGSKAADGL